MLTRCIPILLVLTSPVLANQIVSVGDTYGFAAPNPPYDASQPLMLELTLGYGDPSNTIGDGIWFCGPGILDLSADPNLNGFLAYATNGENDPMYVTVTDGDGFQVTYGFSAWHNEGMLLGSFPDLSPLEITGAELDVFDVGIGDPANGGNGGAVARWVFLGVPEPSVLTLCGLYALLLCRGHRKRHILRELQQ